jgi:hypothetical protein
MLILTDQYGSQTVTLSGTGVAPPGVSLSPFAGLSFAPTGVSLSSAVQTLTLTNNSTAAFSIQSVAVAGDFVMVPGSNTCTSALAIGTACTMQVVFAPTAAGARAGSIAIVDSAPGSPRSVPLTGTGVDFTLAPNGPVSQTIAAGGSATYSLLLRGQAGLPGTAAITCTGAPANSTCIATPSGPPIAGTTVILVTIATNAAAAEMPLRPGGHSRPVWLAVLFPAGLVLLRRARLRSVMTAVLISSALGIGGCAASRLIPATGLGSGASSGGATPKGTYNITVTGTSAGLTRSVGLSLLIQ